jgi:hypothetical protein
VVQARDQAICICLKSELISTDVRDFPLFMQRVKFFPDVADADAVTDIYLPLA